MDVRAADIGSPRNVTGYPRQVTALAPADLQTLAINTLRGLAIDAVEKAKSGHPGMPLGCAPMATALWTQHLRHDPKDPKWWNRDRFILSAGHGSMLLYGLLHLSGYDVPLEQLQQFRQWGSITPGHPENTHTPGVEMATGPLGQGFATSVGFAIAEAFLAARYNKPDFAVMEHFTFVLASDGDLMEGISQEAASLAGHLGLGKLIVLYDCNDITIDGRASEAWSDDVRGRFESLNWHVMDVDGMDPAQVSSALTGAKAKTDQPSLIICKTTIGFGSPNKADHSSSHGAPLGPEEAKLTKQALGLDSEAPFQVQAEARAFFEEAAKRGAEAAQNWRDLFKAYAESYPSEASELEGLWTGRQVLDLEFPDVSGSMATRAANGKLVQACAAAHPLLLGGCADLAESVQTHVKGSGNFTKNDRTGRNIAYGIREHAMAAACNGITLHGGTRAFGGTFLIFSDYCRPSIRLAALMECPTIFVFSHDSIGLGEDGPTHQPIEQVMSLRMIPNLNVMRPGDGHETAVAWRIAMSSTHTPSVIVTSRQAIPTSTPEVSERPHPAERGGYVVREAEQPKVILVATGSELGLAMQAAEELAGQGIPARVVSLFSWHLFAQQDAPYRDSVLPRGVPTLSVEAGTTLGWAKYADAHIGLDRFGASAPGPVLFEQFGFTVANVVAEAKKLI